MNSGKQTAKTADIISIVPGYGERAIFLGQTGSGKSVLAKRLLQETPYRDIVIIDNKHEIHARNAVYIHTPHEYVKKNEGIIIYHPDTQYDNMESYNDLFRLIYLRRHTLVYIDEIYAVCRDRSSPEYLKAIYTRGRSLGISAWGCSQRPRGIPVYTISETNKKYLFTLETEADRKLAASIMGETAEQIVYDHKFLYKSGPGETRLMTYNLKNDTLEVLA